MVAFEIFLASQLNTPFCLIGVEVVSDISIGQMLLGRGGHFAGRSEPTLNSHISSLGLRLGTDV